MKSQHYLLASALSPTAVEALFYPIFVICLHLVWSGRFICLDFGGAHLGPTAIPENSHNLTNGRPQNGGHRECTHQTTVFLP
jgi:hypothetical protein